MSRKAAGSSQPPLSTISTSLDSMLLHFINCSQPKSGPGSSSECSVFGHLRENKGVKLIHIVKVLEHLLI